MLAAYTRVFGLQLVGAATLVVAYWQISLHVGADAFGRYSLYLSLIGLGTTILIGWPNAALLRFGREQWSSRGGMGEAFGTRAVLYLSTVSIGVTLAWLGDGHIAGFLGVTDSPFPWVALGVVILPLADIAVYTQMATGRTAAFGYVPLVNRLALLGAVVLVALGVAQATWNYLVLVALLGALAAALIAFRAVPHRAWERLSVSRAMLRAMLRYSWAVPLGATAAYIVNWIDTWVIRAYLGPEAVGVYSWAYQVTALSAAAFSSLGAVLSPRLVDARLGDEAGYLRRHGQRCVRLMVLAGLLGTLLLPLVFPLLSLGVGRNYQGSYPVLVALLSVAPFQLLAYLINPILNAFEAVIPKAMLIGIGSALVNVLGDLLLVPVLGITGAAVTTVAVLGFSACCQMALARHAIGDPSFPTGRSVALAGSLMPLAAIWLVWGGPIGGSLAAIAWAVAALLATRRAGLYQLEDVVWLEQQPLPSAAKRPLLVAGHWLARRDQPSGRSAA